MNLPNSKLIKRYIVQWRQYDLDFAEFKHSQTSAIKTLNDLKNSSVDPSTIQVYAELTNGLKFHVYGNDE
jgi:hypothetical protein